METKRCKLINRAIMPALHGTYICRYVNNFDKFCKMLTEAEELCSFIDSQQHVELIKRWTGLTVPVNEKPPAVDREHETWLIMIHRNIGISRIKHTDFDFARFDFYSERRYNAIIQHMHANIARTAAEMERMLL